MRCGPAIVILLSSPECLPQAIYPNFGTANGRANGAGEWRSGEVEETVAAQAEAIGVTSQPSVTFWRTLDTEDAVGWGA
jgi:hypothetical protein